MSECLACGKRLYNSVGKRVREYCDNKCYRAAHKAPKQKSRTEQDMEAAQVLLSRHWT